VTAPTSARFRADVAVVGAGAAGLISALAARDAGAAVTVFEKADSESAGGNSAFSGGLFKAVYDGLADVAVIVSDADEGDVIVEPYTAADFDADIVAATDGRADPKLARVLVDESYGALAWLAGLGVRFRLNRVIGTTATAGGAMRVPRGAAILADGKGRGLVRDLQDLVGRTRGIEMRSEADVIALRRPDARHGRWELDVRSNTSVETISADSIVLASGGFQASAMRRAAFLGPQLSDLPIRGTHLNTGDMTVLAMREGAASAGDWSSAHVAPVRADMPPYGIPGTGDESNRLAFPYGITVNLDGRRFIDEGIDFALHRYVIMGHAVAAQRRRTAFQLFDQQTVHLLERRYSGTKPITAASLADLVEAIADAEYGAGLDPIVLLETVREFNAAAEAADHAEFRPDALDRRSTHDVVPAKSNWALPLSKPPFLAYPITAGLTFTFGGLATDGRAAVLDDAGRPISGLFAAGEMVGGFFAGSYPAGASLSRSAVFGMLAGRAAASLRRHR
jgi:tricarballylate dehydrogenase